METTTVALAPPDAAKRPRRWFRLPSGFRRLLTALTPSERRPRTVWVVAFFPCPYKSRSADAVGGFDWYRDWAAADAAYVSRIFESGMGGGSHIVRLVPYRSAHDGGALTAEIEADLDLIEGGELPAAREFVPGRVAPL